MARGAKLFASAKLGNTPETHLEKMDILCEILNLYLLLHQSAELLPEGLGKLRTGVDEFGRRVSTDATEVGRHVSQVVVTTSPGYVGKGVLAGLLTNGQQRLVETLRFQIADIERAGLQIGEDEELEARRKVLQNAEKLTAAVENAVGALYGDVIAALKKAGREDLIGFGKGCLVRPESRKAGGPPRQAKPQPEPAEKVKKPEYKAGWAKPKAKKNARPGHRGKAK